VGIVSAAVIEADGLAALIMDTMPGSPAGQVLISRTEAIAVRDAEIRQLRAEVGQLRALVLADDSEAHAELWRRLAREAADAAHAEGWRAGYEAGARVLADTWPALVATVTSDGPTISELEARRYGPGGRAASGQPRPGDRTGAQIIADARASWLAAGLSLGDEQTAACQSGRESQEGGA